MPHEIEIKLLPEHAFDEEIIRHRVSEALNKSPDSIGYIKILRRSIDARRKPIQYLLKIHVYNPSETYLEKKELFEIKKSNTFHKTVGIIGAGPAGLFAALQLLERGIKPIIIERGKSVKERRRDLAILNKELIVNAESNYCFGEGGAGTYSDGKLYTRSSKRGNIHKVLETFVHFGADDNILIDAHPHIGTNKLPQIIENIRNFIIESGGEFFFDTKLIDFTIRNGKIETIICNDGKEMVVDDLILATGHSARDIFYLLNRKGVFLESKPFALGVRIEHPQDLIDQIQYKQTERGDFLPPAAYSLVTQVNNGGVFSFCMCPGGIIAPCATSDGEIVVNGWSPSKRNGQFANSGTVVSVNTTDWQKLFGEDVLGALKFQEMVEQNAFSVTNSIIAPAQRMEDFIQHKVSKILPSNSYIPGTISSDLHQILPPFIANNLQQGLINFGKSMHGYRTNEAILVGVESRTSSPIRIPRDKEKLCHPQISNLFPCGEGAGFAGGIMSAALDGMACANAVVE
ncbi:MAG: FAD-dependent monooxygenase [Bacteroidetes bacterium]|nr:FAD-dependent monooxygenase [Bacteroidota bacterium]